jgi:hypothetical protein
MMENGLLNISMNLKRRKKNKNIMQDMNKEFEYRGFKFNIKVTLNTKVEKKTDGNRWHTIVTNDMGAGSYYKTLKVEDKLLIEGVSAAELAAKNYVDKHLDQSSPDERLTKIGFK